MCNIVHISTTSPEDLSAAPECGQLLRQADPATYKESMPMLAYPHKWYLKSRYGGCSCHFRHVIFNEGIEPTFGEPEEWLQEESANLEDTAAVYDLLSRLTREGHRVDLIDFWNGEWSETDLIEDVTVTVNLSNVPRNAFRFFEEYRLDFLP